MRLEERGLGVRPVGHHPQRLAQEPEPRHRPPHQLDGQLQLGPERRPVLRVDAGAGPSAGRTAGPAAAGRRRPRPGGAASSPRTTHTCPYTNGPPAGPGVGLWWTPGPLHVPPVGAASSRRLRGRWPARWSREQSFMPPSDLLRTCPLAGRTGKLLDRTGWRSATTRPILATRVGPHSWKKYLFPPVLRLWQGQRTATGFTVQDEHHDPPRRAFLGMCALRAARPGRARPRLYQSRWTIHRSALCQGARTTLPDRRRVRASGRNLLLRFDGHRPGGPAGADPSARVETRGRREASQSRGHGQDSAAPGDPDKACGNRRAAGVRSRDDRAG